MQAERRQLVLGRWAWVALGVVAFGALLYGLRAVLTPIFLAFTIAYILDPVVDRLESWKLPRAAGIAVVLGGFLAAIALFALLVVPGVVTDIANVARELPGHAKRGLAQLEPWLVARGVEIPKSADQWIVTAQKHADSLSKVPLAPVGDALKSIIGGTFSAIGAVFAALIVPILAVYLLNDFDKITAGFRDLIPLRYRDSVVSTAREVDGVLSQFMRGQLTVMAILAVLYGGAYSALGIRLAIPIGIAAGVLNIVPYVGSAFALVAGLLMALLGGGGWFQVGGVVVAYVVVQTLEGFVITPRIVGESVGLREVWVLLALFVGGEIFGFLGVLLAVPAAAVLKIFVGRAVAHYRASALFLTPAEALAAGGTGPPPSEPPPSGAEGEEALETRDEPDAAVDATDDTADDAAVDSAPDDDADQRDAPASDSGSRDPRSEPDGEDDDDAPTSS